MPTVSSFRPSMAARSSAALQFGPFSTTAARASLSHAGSPPAGPRQMPPASTTVPSKVMAAAASRAPQLVPASGAAPPPGATSKRQRRASLRRSRKVRSSGKGWAEVFSRRCTTKLSAVLVGSSPAALKASKQEAAICLGMPRKAVACCRTSAATSKPEGSSSGPPVRSNSSTSSCKAAASSSARRAARTNSCVPKWPRTVSGISSSAMTRTPTR
mmetsp:Transcript_85595/g.277225  ORF Transcript_85595/g.277225 Transcript_85595/m.277225 type:complete len:215 (-) Transcript_85595:23-667(-)